MPSQMRIITGQAYEYVLNNRQLVDEYEIHSMEVLSRLVGGCRPLSNEELLFPLELKNSSPYSIRNATAYITKILDTFKKVYVGESLLLDYGSYNDISTWSFVWYNNAVISDYLGWNLNELMVAIIKLYESLGDIAYQEFIYALTDSFSVIMDKASVLTIKGKGLFDSINYIIRKLQDANDSGEGGGTNPKNPPPSPSDVDLRDPNSPQGLEPLVYRGASFTRFLLEE